MMRSARLAKSSLISTAPGLRTPSVGRLQVHAETVFPRDRLFDELWHNSGGLWLRHLLTGQNEIQELRRSIPTELRIIVGACDATS